MSKLYDFFFFKPAASDWFFIRDLVDEKEVQPFLLDLESKGLKHPYAVKVGS